MTLSNPQELADKHKVSILTVRKLLKDVQPAYTMPMGKGQLHLYGPEADDLLLAYKQAKAEPKPSPAPKLAIDEIVEAIARSDERCQQAQRSLFGYLEKRSLTEDANHSNALRRLDDLNRAAQNQSRDQDILITTLRNRLDALDANHTAIQASIDALAYKQTQILEALQVLQVAQPYVAPAQTVEALKWPTPNPAPTLSTTSPRAKPKPKPIVVLGLTEGQAQVIKQEVGSAYDLTFVQGQGTRDPGFKTKLSKSAFLACLSSFPGSQPEGLAKDAGVACVRAQGGVSGLVEKLVELL